FARYHGSLDRPFPAVSAEGNDPGLAIDRLLLRGSARVFRAAVPLVSRASHPPVGTSGRFPGDLRHRPPVEWPSRRDGVRTVHRSSLATIRPRSTVDSGADFEGLSP